METIKFENEDIEKMLFYIEDLAYKINSLCDDVAALQAQLDSLQSK